MAFKVRERHLVYSHKAYVKEVYNLRLLKVNKEKLIQASAIILS